MQINVTGRCSETGGICDWLPVSSETGWSSPSLQVFMNASRHILATYYLFEVHCTNEWNCGGGYSETASVGGCTQSHLRLGVFKEIWGHLWMPQNLILAICYLSKVLCANNTNCFLPPYEPETGRRLQKCLQSLQSLFAKRHICANDKNCLMHPYEPWLEDILEQPQSHFKLEVFMNAPIISETGKHSQTRRRLWMPSVSLLSHVTSQKSCEQMSDTGKRSDGGVCECPQFHLRLAIFIGWGHLWTPSISFYHMVPVQSVCKWMRLGVFRDWGQ